MLGRIWTWIVAAFAWSEAKDQDWRSWVMHSAIALVLAALFAPIMALGIYGWRELEQIAGYKREGKKIPYTDCVLDFWSPFLTVCTAVALVLGFRWVAAGCVALILAGLWILYRYKRFVRQKEQQSLRWARVMGQQK